MKLQLCFQSVNVSKNAVARAASMRRRALLQRSSSPRSWTTRGSACVRRRRSKRAVDAVEGTKVTRLLRGGDVEEGEARTARKKVPCGGAELVPRCVNHLHLKHRVAVYQVGIQLAALGKLRDASG